MPTVVDAVEKSMRQRARRATGWPLVSWFSRLRPDPLKRLHLDLGAAGKTLTGTSRTSCRTRRRCSGAVDSEVRPGRHASVLAALHASLPPAPQGQAAAGERVTVAVESGLETLILEHAEAAAERAESSWQQLAAGQGLLDSGPADLGRASRELRRTAERSVREWQQDVLEMVRTEGADKRSTARFLAFGVNGLSVALMIVVFAHTAGVTGAEAGVAGGSAVVGQKLLEAVFGDQAVRSLAERSRQALEVRVRALMEAERARYVRLLDGLALRPRAAEEVREASRRVDDLRFAARGSAVAAAQPEPGAEPKGDA